MLAVEPVRGGDLSKVAGLAGAELTERYPLEWWAEQASRTAKAGGGKGAFYVARDVEHDNIVGFAVSDNEACEAHLLAIAVQDEYRGRGIGSALLRHVGHDVACSGAMKFSLDVRVDDEKAQAFYRRHGFAPEGFKERCYSDGADAVRLARPL
ncbi:MAG: GNAT family N-acetyltransferase [Thermoplasmatota archaeon]